MYIELKPGYVVVITKPDHEAGWITGGMDKFVGSLQTIVSIEIVVRLIGDDSGSYIHCDCQKVKFIMNDDNKGIEYYEWIFEQDHFKLYQKIKFKIKLL